tara:strand:- start:2861 stop:3001 length:141 start_codon:yes stop_codon:yes gene_type:complete
MESNELQLALDCVAFTLDNAPDLEQEDILELRSLNSRLFREWERSL